MAFYILQVLDEGTKIKWMFSFSFYNINTENKWTKSSISEQQPCIFRKVFESGNKLGSRKN
jgi:hypothetical protein